MEQQLDLFCASEFWNSSLTWYTDNPDFTICFEKTVFVLVPVVYFWLFLPLEYYWLRKSLNRDVPWTWKNVSKFLIISTICVLCACDFLFNLSEDVPVVKVDIFMPLIKFGTFLCAGVTLYYNKKYGLRASGHQFLFWFLCALFGAFQFRTEITNVQTGYIENQFLYRTYLIYYPLVCFMLVLNFITDARPKVDVYANLENPSPIPDTSYPGRIFYTYYDSLLFKGFKRQLTPKDMWNLEYDCEAKNLVSTFEDEFQRRVAKSRANFRRKQKQGNTKQERPSIVHVIPVIYRCFYPRFIMGALCRLSVDFIMFVNPQILRLLIAFVSSDESRWKGFMYAGAMFVFGLLQSVIHNIHFFNLFYFGLRTRTSLISCIYRKALRISNSARKNKTVGEIVNLMASDAERFQEFAIHLPLTWSAPLEITLAIYFLWQEIGVASLAGVALLILLIPVNIQIVRRTRSLQIKQMKEKDERLKMMNEILTGIKVLKLYAWETSFENIVKKIRFKEIRTMLKAAYLNAISQFIWNCAPFAVAFATFLVYVLIDENNVLDASKAFVSLALINLVRMPMNQIPVVVNNIVQTLVSFKRIDAFMNADELEQYIEHDSNESDPLIIEKGNFSWGEDPVLKNINFRVQNDSIVAIVGPVGCGKSTLINALLGEMEKISGRVNSLGTVAYVPQQAWIQNATVRENIIFGKPFDKIRYNKVVDACALRPDLNMLADGDRTEIGEKGINLSGGQKQRISLARAVYEDADIYLLDDPLSAVDSHVGKHLFSEVIGPNGLLKGKVRVLVTHAITYVSKVDNIFAMKDGEIQESGTHRELLSKKGAFAEFFLQHITNDVSDEEELNELEEQLEEKALVTEIKRRISRQRSRISERSSNLEIGFSRSGSMKSLESMRGSNRNKLGESNWSVQDTKFISEKGKLIDTEKTELGTVKMDVFKYYFSAVGFVAVIGTVLFYFGFQVFGIESNVWLGQWAEDPNVMVDGQIDISLRNRYLYVYGALGVAQGLCILAANVWFARGTTSAATKLHELLMGTVMRLPMAFFDVTPIGRILARFSNDIRGIDLRLPIEFNGFINTSLKILGTLVIICYTTPLFTIVIIPIGVLYIFIQRYFVATTRQIKRLESVSRSPIYSHFSETISGTSIIRAYRCQERFINESERRIDTNQRCVYPANFANRWIAVRLEGIGNVIVFASALFAVMSKDLNASMVGLSVGYSLQLTQTLNMLVRTISDAETSIVAVERIKEYSGAKQEKSWEIAEKKPKSSWPNEGNVTFQNYSVRYRSGLELVLKNLSFIIHGGEKIGVVGRTGAGKSSLTLSLFRIIEAAGGDIFIDGVNISEIGLHDLRSKLTIIPQDSVLFSGTLRLNLDPFETYSDEEIWRAVELAHLKTFVLSLPAGIYHQVSEGGANLSVGQRQLVCLARALLRKTKILILDEATAAVDLETDDLIQKTIRTEFVDSTIITIAHRLNTIMDSNRILVLDQGQITEFGTPDSLLTNRDSVFFGMCKDAGLVN
ncbi:multidrug resistance-associated protein 1-like isoform X2 [Euwallacea similis]|uniref:multidrug resistance-associated protein 1-like isoform X2 n=1 Tax=Euwallacea similis TaxID=1736056 RepID=UPI00345040CC